MSTRDRLSEARDEALGSEGEGQGSPPPRSQGGRRWTAEQRAAAKQRMKDKWADGTAPRNRPRGAPAPEPPPEPPRPVEVTEEEARAWGRLGGSIWRLAGPMIGLQELNDEQKLELGRALAPVVKKWTPFLDKWAEETNLAMVVFVLWDVTRIRKKPEPEAEPRDVEFEDVTE